MPDPESLANLRSAVDSFLATADQAAVTWTQPRAPGKWSPSQVVEHVARVLEECANMVAGAPSKFPTFPRPLRLVARLFVFRRILRRGAFFRMKSLDAFKPVVGPESPVAGRRWVEGALARFDQACRARAARNEPVSSPLFGPVSVGDFARFQELHVRHHQQQIQAATLGSGSRAA